MNSSTKLLRWASSWQVIACLMASLMLVSVPVMVLSGLSVIEFLRLVPTKIFVLLLFLASLVRLIRCALDRTDILLPLGFSVIFLGLLLNYAFSFTGITVLGPGEEFDGTGYERTETGVWGGLPKLRLKVEKIEGGKTGKTELKLNTTEIVSLVAGSSSLDRFFHNPFSAHIRILKTGVAPQFVIASQSGKVLDSMLVKVGYAEDEMTNYFRSPELPHRIYFMVADDVHKQLSLMITRGKLTIQDWKTVKLDEKLEFEGFAVYFTEVVRWVEIEVSVFPGNPVMLVGGIIILLAGVRFLRGQIMKTRP